MNEKEKAKELVMKFQYLVTGWDCYHDEPIELIHRLSDMKKCALICVDEMIREIKQIQFNHDVFLEDTEISYWWKVRQEINKL